MPLWSLLAALLPVASVLCASSSVTTYIATEGPIAHTKLLANIGPNGAQDEGASPGVVVAAPSTDPGTSHHMLGVAAILMHVSLSRLYLYMDSGLLAGLQDPH